jgi:hypothetical protein
MVWELREHDVEHAMSEIREAIRYWERNPDAAAAFVRVNLAAGLDSIAGGLATIRAPISQALAAAQTDFRFVVTRHHGWAGRLEHLYKRLVRKSTGWLFFQQGHINKSLAGALVHLAQEVSRLSERVERLETELAHERARPREEPPR